MLGITLPHVDAWNVWWSDYGNTTVGFAEQKARVDDLARSLGRDPTTIESTAAVLVRLEGGGGRQMGDYGAGERIEPVTGTTSEIADQLAAFAAAGADHLQLVVDPITRTSIELLGDVLAAVPRG